MEITVIVLLFTSSIYLLLYQFRARLFGIEETHLPEHVFEKDAQDAQFSNDRYAGQAKRPGFRLPHQFSGLEKRIPLPTDGIKRKLLKAGSPLGVVEFLGFKLLALILLPTLSFIFLGDKFSKEMLLAGSLAVGFFIPELWLNNKIKRRQASIKKDLPNIIDLLNLCVSGGMDFMLAVNRVVKDLKPCDVTRELSEVYRETQMGKSRREALKNLSRRVDLPEVHSFVRTLIQADRMGTPMAEALNMQSEEMRVRRFQNGESMALKAPIKLLFPLFAFILPVVLIIVGGPIILQFVRGSLNFGF